MTIMRHRAILFKPPQVSVDLTVTESKKETIFENSLIPTTWSSLLQCTSISLDSYVYPSKENSGKPSFAWTVVKLELH